MWLLGFGQALQASRASLAGAPFLRLACGLANSLFLPSTLQEERDKEAIVTLYVENEPDTALKASAAREAVAEAGRTWVPPRAHPAAGEACSAPL